MASPKGHSVTKGVLVILVLGLAAAAPATAQNPKATVVYVQLIYVATLLLTHESRMSMANFGLGGPSREDTSNSSARRKPVKTTSPGRCESSGQNSGWAIPHCLRRSTR
jgi:hypothetical protein